MNHPTLSRSRSKLNRRFASFYKKSLYYISLMSYVKSFKELARKRRCFSFAGAKVDTFHNMTKHSRNFFKRNLKKKLRHIIIYYIEGGAEKEGGKALLREIRGFSRPKSGREKYGFRNIEKRDEEDLLRLVNLFSSPCK